MKITDRLKTYMEEEPLARERSNRWRTIPKVIANHYGMVSNDNKIDFTVTQFRLMCQDSVTLDRAFRKIQEEYEELRGSDYNDKDMLEQKAEVALGYSADYQNDVKTLKKI